MTAKPFKLVRQGGVYVHLKLVWREPLFILRIFPWNGPKVIRFENLLPLSGCENISKPLRNRPHGHFPLDQKFRFAFLEIPSGKWNNTAGFPGSQFPSYRFPSSSVLASGSWVPQLISFRLLGCQFLSSWRPVPRVFAEDSSVHPLLPCTFALSRFSRRLKSWGMFVRMEGVKCLLTMVGFALRPCSIL